MLVRAVIVLLLVLNVGVAAWWIARDPAPPPAPIEPPPGVARLQLVAETGAPVATRPPTAAMPAEAAAPTASTAPPARQCYSFGPFASRPAADAATATLQATALRITAREQVDAANARGWRVFLPPLPTREEAQATAARIGAAGFNDFLVVREGAEANSIALGRYRNQASAQRRTQALTAAGFPARMEPLGAVAASTWLDVVAANGFDPRQAQAAIAAAQYQRQDCPPDS